MKGLNIGLYNLESKIFNTALMQVSYYHKKYGDKVNFYNPKNNYDLIYCFSLFNFTNKKTVTNNMICGGTGFDLITKLPYYIENCNLDYSIYPNCLTSYIWFSRGCNNNCKFCIVNKKEGNITTVKPKNINKHGIYITVMDNNFFQNPIDATVD